VGGNSIRALKLSTIVPSILKKETYISGQFYVSAVAVYIWWAFDDILFSPIFLKVKGMKTPQMFFEDCVGPNKSAISLNQTSNV